MMYGAHVPSRRISAGGKNVLIVLEENGTNFDCPPGFGRIHQVLSHTKLLFGGVFKDRPNRSRNVAAQLQFLLRLGNYSVGYRIAIVAGI